MLSWCFWNNTNYTQALPTRLIYFKHLKNNKEFVRNMVYKKN